MFYKSIFPLLISFLIIPGLSAQENVPQKVLFVGNSYTYFWNLPQTVMLMAEAKEVDMQTNQSTAGGSNLGQHWRSARNLQSVDLIKSGAFDAVILQDHSMRAIEAPDSLKHYGKLLAELARKNGSDIYLYMTWSREWAPNMQQVISHEYRSLAKEIGAKVIPVGLAWQRARELRPDIELYDPDGSHPNTLGTYLSACVFFGILTGESPMGLPNRLITKDQNGEKLYINIQSKNTALFFQKVADEIINESNK